jgi:tetratricopeptide (TPR) repeat protein
MSAAAARNSILATVLVPALFVMCAPVPTTAQERDSADVSPVSFRISCSANAQREFNRAITLLHHMTYPRAREAFEQVARLDARCAMAHWGLAMTLFQPLWPTRPSPAELQRGWTAVQTARSLEPATELERRMIDAVAAFFADPTGADYWVRIARWEKASAEAHAALPGDPEAAAFYALAHLAAASPDSVIEYSARAAEVLLEVYARNPEHPGAMHYLVHANDAPGRQGSSLDVTRKYESSAPRNPHALHMPTHIYTRLGDWPAVIRGNLLAAEVALEHPAGDEGQFIWDEFPHAVEYLIYAYLQQGRDEEAAAELRRLTETGPLQPTFKTAFHLSSTRARYALERHAWGEAASLPPREPATLDWDRYTWPEAITWYARGLGAAHQRRIGDVRLAERRLAALEEVAAQTGEILFATNIRVLRLEVGAWLAHIEGDRAASVALMKEAAELEIAAPKHAVTPAPTLPAFELMGDLLMEQGRPADALAAYVGALHHHPLRLNSLLGAARAAVATGDRPLADTYYRHVLRIADEASRRAVLEEARTFLARQ